MNTEITDCIVDIPENVTGVHGDVPGTGIWDRFLTIARGTSHLIGGAKFTTVGYEALTTVVISAFTGGTVGIFGLIKGLFAGGRMFWGIWDVAVGYNDIRRGARGIFGWRNKRPQMLQKPEAK